MSVRKLQDWRDDCTGVRDTICRPVSCERCDGRGDDRPRLLPQLRLRRRLRVLAALRQRVYNALMTSRAQGLLREALTLPIDERASVAAELLASLDSDAIENLAEVEAAWATEIERRARRVMAGESQGIAWEDVRARAEAALRKP